MEQRTEAHEVENIGTHTKSTSYYRDICAGVYSF